MHWLSFPSNSGCIVCVFGVPNLRGRELSRDKEAADKELFIFCIETFFLLVPLNFGINRISTIIQRVPLILCFVGFIVLLKINLLYLAILLFFYLFILPHGLIYQHSRNVEEEKVAKSVELIKKHRTEIYE